MQICYSYDGEVISVHWISLFQVFHWLVNSFVEIGSFDYLQMKEKKFSARHSQNGSTHIFSVLEPG